MVVELIEGQLEFLGEQRLAVHGGSGSRPRLTQGEFVSPRLLRNDWSPLVFTTLVVIRSLRLHLTAA